MLREQLRKIVLMAIVINSSVSFAAEAQKLMFGNYVGAIYGDGSGSLGEQYDPSVTMGCTFFNCKADRKQARVDPYFAFQDRWQFQIKIDEMTDEKKITIYRDPYQMREKYGEQKLTNANISLWINLSNKNKELLCVKGHDFPDTKGMIRVDKNDPATTNKNGCLLLNESLDRQLRSGTKITIRGSHWPYAGPETQRISLGGYSAVIDFLRSIRDTDQQGQRTSSRGPAQML
jgi:hypothetical protein